LYSARPGVPTFIDDNTGMPAAAQTSSPISCITGPLSSVDADLVVVPWFEESTEERERFAALDQATGGQIARALDSGEFRGRPFELFTTPFMDRTWRSGRVALAGAGKMADYTPFTARRLAAAAGLAARQWRVSRLAFLLRTGLPDASGEADVAGFTQAVVEGLTLAEFDGGRYKTGEPSIGAAPRLWIVLEDPNAPPTDKSRCESAIARGRILGECSNAARALANEPGNALTPREFATRAAALAGEAGVAVEILDEQQIESLGMGLLMGVARGSSEPPRLIVFRYEPPGHRGGPTLGLVGKGVTFDTGGISIKPATGMERMKDDMAGGAAVAAAMRAIAMLGAPVKVIGVVPTTENMPGGRAIKPGDVLRSAEGKTVEVINTDAEGRLILGDALWYARKLGATHLVDVATLTGAINVALGAVASGIFGTPDKWVDQVRRVAERCGDRVWPMPLFDEYRDQLKSEIADMMNVGGRPGGSSTAAIFLKEFTGGLPWVHLDIAATAWAEEAKPYLPKGPSGVAVRTLAELAFTADSWPT
jgi:leucyl aminopeptidase